MTAEGFAFEMSHWEIVVRATLVYLLMAAAFRFIPKRQTGNMSPNDILALIVIGSLAANAITGEAHTIADIVLMMAVVLAWDYLFNLLEYYFPRLRHVSQHSPTLLIHNGNLLHANLRKEKLTEQELNAGLRKRGITDIRQVRQAVLEVDGEISVIEAGRDTSPPR